jgi:hypothetical protein
LSKKELEDELKTLQENLQAEMALREKFMQQITTLESKLKKATEELTALQSRSYSPSDSFSSTPLTPTLSNQVSLGSNSNTSNPTSAPAKSNLPTNPSSNALPSTSQSSWKRAQRPSETEDEVQEKKTSNEQKSPPQSLTTVRMDTSPPSQSPTTGQPSQTNVPTDTTSLKEDFQFSEGNSPTNDLEKNPVIREGWLEKKGQNRRNWNKRWFILRKGLLSYYKTQDPKTLKGRVSLIRSSLLTHAEKNGVEKPNVFAIRNPERDFIIRGKSLEEKEEWVQSIRQCILDD